ncbi:acyltransferase-domain-containing protein [Crepidotus variabilis]|uniref:Tafazzin family protein n=1 Tax=Crepidotus variabilis TaxID=179855 RepID=A0A9P6ETN2_9AGAR|nr:acyltransferase-domain-containing protein [Crepidotus variabilis]
MAAVLRALTVGTIGLASKLFLNSGLCSVRVNGLETLKSALDDHSRRSAGQGVVTVCNHISTLDDPLTWGILPARYYLHAHTTRWALGASDIIFTNPIFRTFFNLGHTLETFRGTGIYQASVNKAISQLNKGHWVHLFGEGKINQPHTYHKDVNGRALLPRFKWGVGRMLMETKVPPLVIPMWITGFDQLMPEGRPFPNKYIPRIGARLTVTFGHPIPADEIRRALIVERNDGDVDASAVAKDPERLEGWLGDEAKAKGLLLDISADKEIYTSLIRQKVTAIIQRDVEALGRRVSGDSLQREP